MKRVLKIAALFACGALAGCGWDMTAQGWAKATELCTPFGGVLAANENWDSGGWRQIVVRCNNGQEVKRYYSRDELSGKKYAGQND